MTNQEIIDRAVILDNEIKNLTKEYKILRDLIIEMGLGEHHGSVGFCNVRQNADSKVFDSDAAFKYVSERISPQLLSSCRQKFTDTKVGSIVVTPKAKPAKVIA